MNADTGVILFEKEPHKQCFPASITKIATALYALEHLNLSHIVTVSAESLRKKPPKKDWSTVPSFWLETEGTSAGLVKGSQYSVEALLHGLMLVSGNDAANALAETISGSVLTFIDHLNTYLSDAGCLRTHFCAPHGLHHPEHLTTAYDMAILTRKALQNPKFREIVSKQKYREWNQANQLLRAGPFFYPKAIGVKTGFTSLAGYNLVAAAQHEGRTLIAVVLGCEKREERYLDAISLFETAFTEQKIHRVLFRQSTVLSKELEGGKNPLSAVLTKELAIDYYPSEEPLIQAKILWKIPPLPILKGTQVGELQLSDGQSSPLITSSNVDRTFIHFLKSLFE